MKKSLAAPSPSGTQLQRSEPVAVVPSTPTGASCSRETVTVLSAMLFSLFYHTLSSDVMALSMIQAKRLALKDGVTEEKFLEVMEHIQKTWQVQRDRNPLSGLF